MEAEIAAAVVEQGLSLFEIEAFDFGDEDGVIARDVFLYDVAGQMRESICEQRDTGRSPLKADAETGFLDGILLRLGKELGEGLLRILEDVYTKTSLCLEIGEKARLVVDADKNQ
jgi:hypothetical protein